MSTARTIAEQFTLHAQQCLKSNFDRECNCDHAKRATPLEQAIASALTAASAAQEAEIASLKGRIDSAIACAQRDCEVNPQFRGGLEPIIGILGGSHD